MQMRNLHVDSGRIHPGVAAILLGILAVSISLTGHEGSRAARVLVLMAPLFIWLRWPVVSRFWKSTRFFVVSTILCLFVLDGAIRAFLLRRYQAVPESAMVLAAIGNTSMREAIEYAQSLGMLLWLSLSAYVISLCAVVVLTAACSQHRQSLSKIEKWTLVTLLVVCSVGYLSKPWRKYHPIVYWPTWTTTVLELRSGWFDQEEERSALMANAYALQPRVASNGRSTVVLVLTDSINRDNMSLYGYGRETTPQLLALSKEESKKWLTVPYAWSTEPGTLASLSGMFSFGMRGQSAPVGDTQHILALARAAGYRVWWMSNHDDIAIEQQHARLADSVEMVNRQPGRGSSSLDSELLDCLQEALNDDAPRKLIVVHLLGAHPDYKQRSPSRMRPFDAGQDAVEAQMVSEGRPLWLRELRQTYDAAIRYHDGVVAETARLTRKFTPEEGQGAWMYLSDHGQEVGHSMDHAGHSSATEAGYRIPMLLWRSSESSYPTATKMPFRADWSGWILADLMGLEWDSMLPEKNFLDARYRWVPPDLPVKKLTRFDR
jgi:heptose-I-phosphate ethanolaminephosphotransferase